MLLSCDKDSEINIQDHNKFFKTGSRLNSNRTLTAKFVDRTIVINEKSSYTGVYKKVYLEASAPVINDVNSTIIIRYQRYVWNPILNDDELINEDDTPITITIPAGSTMSNTYTYRPAEGNGYDAFYYTIAEKSHGWISNSSYQLGSQEW